MSSALYLLDGYSLIFRSYFAFIRNPLRNPKGENSSAVFGFFRSLFTLLSNEEVAYFAVVLDSKTPTFRHEQFEQYKATREETPEDLRAQIPKIEEILEVLKLPAIRVNGYEADDIMATLALQCKEAGRDCYLITGDKDMLQLVGGKVHVLKPEPAGGFTEMTEERVYDRWSVQPSQMLDLLALIGDSVDNVPGVKGIGEKTAAKLLGQYGTLDGVYENLEQLSSKSWRTKLEEGRDDAYMSKQLITLETDVPIDGDLEQFKLPQIDKGAAIPHFEREGMHSLVQEVRKELAETEQAEANQQSAGQGGTGQSGSQQEGAGRTTGQSSFQRSGAGPAGAGQPAAGEAGARHADAAQSGDEHGPARDADADETGDGHDSVGAADVGGEVQADAGQGRAAVSDAAASAPTTMARYVTDGAEYRAVRSIDELVRLVEELRAAEWVAFDSETDNIDPMRARPVGFSFSTAAQHGVYVPLTSPEVSLPEEETRDALAKLFGDTSVHFIGQNLKYDYKVMARWGAPMHGIAFDTMIAAWVLDAAAGSFGLDALAKRYLGYEPISYSEVVPKPKRGEEEMLFGEVPLERALVYASEDADISFRLYELFRDQLEEQEQLSNLFYELEMPLVPLLAEMELSGIGLDTKVLEDYSVELERELAGLEREIYDLCGREFNIASTKQLQQVLFEERKLNPVKKTKTGYSTDTAVLQELAREDPVPEKVLQHRTLSKLKSTYVDTLPKLVHPETGRVHTSFNQTGTATGRISSNDPNLQNIPIRDEAGRRIRQAFVPTRGKRFVSADYSQIELVVLAHLSGDPALGESFRTGEDVHTRTGALIFGGEPEEITSEQRRIAKTINFGVMYGMSAFRLSRELGIPRADAETFIQRYFGTYSKIREFIDRTVAEAEESGKVTTILGRERRLPDINNKNKTVKSGAERIAVNTPIQGSAADIVKRSMHAVAARLRKEKLETKLLLQVHDELILEAPEGEIETVSALLREEMVAAVELSVPLRVSVEVGSSWGDLH